MFVGDELQKRMATFNYSIKNLVDEAIVDEETIVNLLDNNISLTDIDKFDLELIASALYCSVEYFTTPAIRSNDLINASINRGENDPETNIMKAKVQHCTNDLLFLKSLIDPK